MRQPCRNQQIERLEKADPQRGQQCTGDAEVELAGHRVQEFTDRDDAAIADLKGARSTRYRMAPGRATRMLAEPSQTDARMAVSAAMPAVPKAAIIATSRVPQPP